MHALPVVALGGGITLAAVLNVLRQRGLPYYALCPHSDFVSRSRWYRSLPTALANPGPADLVPLLDSLEIESAVLLPCSDDWLRAVAALPEVLAKRFPSSVSRTGVDVLTDKWRFARLLDRLGVPHPNTVLLSSREQLLAFPDSIFQGAILKPLYSVDFATKYGVKGYLVETRQQAVEVLAKIEFPIMLQEFIAGPPTAGYFLDGFRDRRGRVTALFARQRLRMHPAKLGNSTLIQSVPLRNLHGAVFPLEYLLQEISHRGVFSAEFKFDARDRAFKLIEINARPWWYVEFADRCGVDVCTMAYRDALGLSVDTVHDYEVGRRCVFPMNDLRAWKDRNQQRANLWSVFETWCKSDSTPFHWNDPVPALTYLGQALAAFFRTDRRSEAQAESHKLRESPRYEPNEVAVPPVGG